MQNKLKINVNESNISKDERDIELSLPYGEFKFKIDFLDGGMVSRAAELEKCFVDTDVSTDQKAKEYLKSLKNLSNCIDYVFNVNVGKEIYGGIDPLSIYEDNGNKTFFCLYLMTKIQEHINEIRRQENISKNQEEMKDFVNKHA